MTEAEQVDPQHQLKDILDRSDGEALRKLMEEIPYEDRLIAFSRISPSEQASLLMLLSPGEAADLLDEIPTQQATEAVETLPANDAAQIIDELRSDKQADILSDLDAESTAAILLQLPEEGAAQARSLLAYDPECAGGLMILEYLSYPENWRIGDIVSDLRRNSERYADYDVQYAYITTVTGELIGVIRMRDLLFARENQIVRNIMIKDPLRVKVSDSLESLTSFFEDHGFFGVPAVDDNDVLVGVVRRTDVYEAAGEKANRLLLKITGIVGGEELRSLPTHVRSGRRLSWLSINIVLNIIAASVIAFYESTLQQVIALAVFLPIISDMSGCSGNQAVAVSIREMTVGLLKPREFARVLYKESAVGLINGLILGALLGAAAYLWRGNWALGVVVGTAMALNTLVSVCFGGLVPLVIKGMRLDPALVSGPMLTTVTDMCGFFFVLGFASLMLTYLV